MGGRGSSSAVGRASPHLGINVLLKQVPQKPKTASDYDNITDLRKYAQNTLQIKLAEGKNSLDDADFELVKQAVVDYEFFKDEFPQWIGTLTGFRMTSQGQYANASTNGEIVNFSEKYKDGAKFAKTIAQQEAIGWNPKGATSKTVAVHEIGHTFEWAMCKKYINTGNQFMDNYDRADAWNKKVYAKQIVSNAAKEAKKYTDGKGKTNDQLIGEVSGYATKNRAETLAECVRDYYINRNNAKALSRAVWSELKKEFG